MALLNLSTVLPEIVAAIASYFILFLFKYSLWVLFSGGVSAALGRSIYTNIHVTWSIRVECCIGLSMNMCISHQTESPRKVFELLVPYLISLRICGCLSNRRRGNFVSFCRRTDGSDC